jgi:hypothetical protein
MAKVADACMLEPSCDEDAAKLASAAIDLGVTAPFCFRLYYGAAVPKDAARARACFERSVGASACDTGSPSLDRLYLATMLLDGQGGAADVARARSLLADCFQDIAVTGVLEQIDKRKAPDPARAPLDFCKDIGGTTLSMGECIGVDEDRATIAQAAVERRLLEKLGRQDWPLVERARVAARDFATKAADVAGDTYRTGTIASNHNVRTRVALAAARTEALAAIADGKPLPLADLVKAEGALAQASREACGQDAARSTLCDGAKKAFLAYRDVEAELYAKLRGPSGANAAKALVTSRYASTLSDVNRP